ncbi:hypothetical protein [Fretibacter rubidus]|uniref:hypothetical protein n=1 Tax=Fretibacter rubidus TaxID=570162 RepID=UPI00352B0934
MKNKLTAFLLTASFAAVLAPSAYSQSIEQGTLGAAQDFDAGTMTFASGGLDPALWQGTSAATAKDLIARAPIQSTNPIIRDMVRTVILSAGVPPEGASTDYGRTRLAAVMALGDPGALQGVAQRLPELTSDPAVRADLALAMGDVAGACTMADSISEGRGTPMWARLRSFCHVTRDEIPAAELTANLLKKSGYEDALFFGLMNRLTGLSKKSLPDDLGKDPLYSAMANAVLSARADAPVVSLSATGAAQFAKDTTADKDLRLAAVFKAGSALSNDEINSVMNGLIYDGVTVENLQTAGAFDMDSVADIDTGLGFAQHYQLAKRGSGLAMTAVLQQAQKSGALMRFADVLKQELVNLPATEKIEHLDLYAGIAVIQDDIATLQALFGALPDGPQKVRIAFAADAIGQGFRLGTLGDDIEGRLSAKGEEGRRAVRDALIALSLGSTLTDAGAKALSGKRVDGTRTLPAGDIAVLRSVAKRSSRAETTLRAAILLDGATVDAASFAAVIEAMSTAQLYDFAGRLAAQDFLDAI